MDFDEFVRMGLSDGLREPVSGFPLRNSCHDRSPAPVCWMAKPAFHYTRMTFHVSDVPCRCAPSGDVGSG